MEQGLVNNITVEIGVRKLYTMAPQGLSLMVYEPAHKPGCINATTSVLEMTRINIIAAARNKINIKKPNQYPAMQSNNLCDGSEGVYIAEL